MFFDRIIRIDLIFFMASSLRLVEPTPRRDEAEKIQFRFSEKKDREINNGCFLPFFSPRRRLERRKYIVYPVIPV